MKEIKAIVFDVGGVLIDNPNIKGFWKESPSSKELRDKFGTGKISKEKFISIGALIQKQTKKEFIESYRKIYFSIKPKKDVIQTFRKIKTDKYLLSDTNPIHSSKIKELLKREIKMTKENFFSHKIKLRKIDDSAFYFVIKKIDVPAENILFIDDKVENIQRARDKKIQTVLFKNNSQLIKDLRRLRIQ